MLAGPHKESQDAKAQGGLGIIFNIVSIIAVVVYYRNKYSGNILEQIGLGFCFLGTVVMSVVTSGFLLHPREKSNDIQNFTKFNIAFTICYAILEFVLLCIRLPEK
jgi:hypothetical protein